MKSTHKHHDHVITDDRTGEKPVFWLSPEGGESKFGPFQHMSQAVHVAKLRQQYDKLMKDCEKLKDADTAAVIGAAVKDRVENNVVVVDEAVEE